MSPLNWRLIGANEVLAKVDGTGLGREDLGGGVAFPFLMVVTHRFQPLAKLHNSVFVDRPEPLAQRCTN